MDEHPVDKRDVIEPDEIYVGESKEKKQPYSVNQDALKGIPIGIRFLTFLFSFFALLYAIGGLFCTFTAWLMAALTLFRSTGVNMAYQDFWRYSKAGFAIFAGLFLFTFSPSLGLAILLGYLSVAASEKGQAYRTFRSTFDPYINKEKM